MEPRLACSMPYLYPGAGLETLGAGHSLHGLYYLLQEVELASRETGTESELEGPMLEERCRSLMLREEVDKTSSCQVGSLGTVVEGNLLDQEAIALVEEGNSAVGLDSQELPVEVEDMIAELYTREPCVFHFVHLTVETYEEDRTGCPVELDSAVSCLP